MSDNTPTAPPQPPVPAGWYPDPEHPAQQRYWSGQAWTEHRAAGPAADGTEPTQPLPVAPAPYRGADSASSQKVPTASAAWWRKPWLLVAGGVLVGATLVAMGSGGSEEPTATAAVVPTPTVTVTATATATEQVKVETTVTATPKARPTKAAAAESQQSGSSGGGGTFVVPNEVGKNLQIAQDDVQEASGDPFFVSFSEDATGADRFQALDSGWQVCSQDPVAGARIGFYDDVTFYVVRTSETCP